jgi:hypothetical protein
MPLVARSNRFCEMSTWQVGVSGVCRPVGSCRSSLLGRQAAFNLARLDCNAIGSEKQGFWKLDRRTPPTGNEGNHLKVTGRGDQGIASDSASTDQFPTRARFSYDQVDCRTGRPQWPSQNDFASGAGSGIRAVALLARDGINSRASSVALSVERERHCHPCA